ncbi:phage integrase family protein [Variovorax humicola]|uniref:Phage integrase family protein n=1 Tax=Variovorax humicola TaxID=1769758 RepID=A0ABU8W4Y7_9BURK
MRALLQGLDERESWNRYLRGHGETADLRTIRNTIAWIRDVFASAALREARPGTARLIRLDPERFDAGRSLPSLEDFAAERGLEDFSAAEQAEAYAEAFPEAARPGAGGGRPTQRARVIAHQLEALRWLESHVAQDPRPGDHVSAWLNPAVATRLQRTGLATLSALVEHINRVGARWWRQVPGVGAHKAARVMAWLGNQAHVPGLRLHAHVAVPHFSVPAHVRAAAVAPATAMVPLEKFRIPPELDGRAGRYRAPPERCSIAARNDHEALHAWLAAKAGAGPCEGGPGSRSPNLSATQRAYRKEAERLLLWSVLVRAKSLSSLSPEDAVAYSAFLANPPPAWCGPRHHQRWSPQWRPFEGPLSLAAQRHAMTVLKALYGFLASQNYVVGNPFSEVTSPPAVGRTPAANRTLNFEQWDRLETLLSDLPDTEPSRRLARALRWIYATGLRLSEITVARCGDLAHVDPAQEDEAMDRGWRLSIEGTGRRRQRQVPVPSSLVAELNAELVRNGLGSSVRSPAVAAVPILARHGAAGPPSRAWSASGLAKAIKALLQRLAADLDPIDASHLRKASAHWLRRTHGAHALQGRGGRQALPLEVVRDNLGHASRQTTSA